MSELPLGWVSVPLDAVSNLIRGVTYNKNESADHSVDGYLPVLRANNIQNGKLQFDGLVFVLEHNIKDIQKVKKGDIVVAMSSGSKRLVGKCGIAETDFNGGFGAFCGVLRPNQHLSSKYVGLYTLTKEYSELVSSLSKGVNINNLKPDHFSEINIPIAPLNEQIRIADKLDSLLAKVDEAQARLEKIPTLLKRFRQSVLAAATSGELSREWREQNEKLWTPEFLKISAIAKKEKYSLGIGPFGSNLKVDDYRDSGHPLIFVRDIRAQKFWHEKTVYIEQNKFDELSAHRALPGDLLITKMGDPPGDLTIYPDNMPEAVITADCIKLRVNENILIKEYAAISLRSKYFQDQISAITAGVAQQKVNLKKFKDLEILVIPLEEQTEIVRRVESLFTQADAVEKQYLAAKQRLDRLSQSLLAKAFRGDLVPQDPNDEPAAELLKRIQAERQSQMPNKRQRKPNS